MNAYEFWFGTIIVCAIYYTIKNYLAYKRGKDF